MSKYRKAVRFSTEIVPGTEAQEQKPILIDSDRSISEAQDSLVIDRENRTIHNLRPKTAHAKNSNRTYDNDVKLGLIESNFGGNKVTQTQTLSDRSLDSQQVEKFVDRPKTRRKLSIIEDSEPRKTYSPLLGENKSFQRRTRHPSSQVGISFVPRYQSRTMSAIQPAIAGSSLKTAELFGQGSKDPLKSDLQEINYRLSHYIQHVRDLRLAPSGGSGGAENTIQLHHSLSTLEQEIRNLKHIYEGELESMRQMYAEALQEKTRHDLEVRKLKSQIRDFEQRITLEVDGRQKATSQVEVLQRTVQQREQELHDARSLVKQPLDELAEVQRNASAWWSQLQDMTRSCDHERLQRQEADDRVLQLQKKLEFNDRLHEQEKADQIRRMKDMGRVIVELEQKVEELKKPDSTVADMVAQAQLMAESDIRLFQQETEKYFTRSLAELKGQLDEQVLHSKELCNNIERLKVENDTLASKLKTIAGELAVANQERLSAEELLRREQLQAQSNVQTMERRLRDLQDLLVVKMREAVSARDAQGLLKTEIDTLRTMLEDEERRLRLSSSCCVTAKINGAASRPESVGVLPVLSTTSGAVSDKLLSARVIPITPVGGPVRTRSAAPASDVKSKASLVPASQGRGKEYFDEMYKDVQVKPTMTSVLSADAIKQAVTAKNGSHAMHNMYTSSAIGDLKVIEVSKEGHFIRLINASTQRCEEFGGYVLQQNVMGKMVCSFRFPPYTKFPANAVITVWAYGSKEYANAASSEVEFVCSEDIDKWGCGPEFTTILCKPNGQAVAWMTASNPYKALLGPAASTSAAVLKVADDSDETRGGREQATVSESLPVSRSSVSVPAYTRTDSLLLENSDTDNSQFAFYSLQPNDSLPYLPNADQTSSFTAAPSKSSPIPGAPYAGASAQRMGSGKLRQYTLHNMQQSPTVMGRGVLVKKPSGVIKFAPGSPVLSPMQQQFVAASHTGRTGLLA